MAGSSKLAICSSSLTRICCPPARSGKAFPDELQEETVHDLDLLGLSTSIDDATGHAWWTLLLAIDGRATRLL